MKIEFLKDGTTLTVKPEGRLDTATSPVLEHRMQPEIEGMTDVIMDLEEVDYISSGGLRVLLAVEQRMEQCNGFMKLRHVNPNIMEILNITGFVDLLTIE